MFNCKKVNKMFPLDKMDPIKTIDFLSTTKINGAIQNIYNGYPIVYCLLCFLYNGLNIIIAFYF